MASSLVLIAGEDSNDTSSLAHLIRAILPDDMNYVARALRRPPILRRDAAPAKRRSMAQEVAALAQPFVKNHSKVITIAHRDCDAIEPAHMAEADSLEDDLKKAGAPNPIAATPAWEMETWWMLFPDAVQATRRCWRRIDYSKVNVGMIENAKERLTRDLRPRDGKQKCPDYKEVDSISIAHQIHKLNLDTNVDELQSMSLHAFRLKLIKAFD